MYTRFLFALAIALSIFTVSTVTRAALARQDSVVRIERTAYAPSHASANATLLPTVVVRPDALSKARARQAASATSASGLEVSTAALEQAGDALAGRVHERVARVSLLVPYYAFGGGAARKTE